MGKDNGIIKILLADDDLELISIIRKKLEQKGSYRILEANNGEEALSIAIEQHPDLILLDVMMPVLNGWEVCKYLRSKDEYQDIGIIMLTAIGPNLNELTSPLYGADDYLDKPFDFNVLQEKINKILKERRKI